MESHAQSVDDHLIDSLSYKLKLGDSYVTDRRSVTYFPQGGNSYSSNNVKVIKIMLTGDQWMDPSTLKLQFRLRNDATVVSGKQLVPFTVGPHQFFRRFRLICGAQVVEDIDNYNRTTEMFHMMQAENKRLNDAIEGFGGTLTETPTGIAAGSERVGMFTPLSGLLNQDKYLPIRYCPIQLEFELVSSGGDAVRTKGAGGDENSLVWSISDVQLKCDVISSDNALDNEYASHLLSRKSLQINFSSYATSVQTAGSTGKQTVNLSRALTRMKSIFVSMFQAPTDRSGNVDNKTYNETNLFWHPMSGTYNATTGQYAPAYDSSKELSFTLQIGSNKFPEYPIQNAAEAYYQLRKSLGIHGSAFHSINIKGNEFITNMFVLGTDTEKILSAAFSGYNTKSGDLITLALENNGLANGDRIHSVLHYDAILNIRDSGVEMLD